MTEASNKRRRSTRITDRTDRAAKAQKTNDAQTNGNHRPTPSPQLNTVCDLIDARASEAALQDQPSVLYPSHGTHYVAYMAADIQRLSQKAAAYYNNIVPRRTSSKEKPWVIALLGPSSFAYLITFLGLSRLGHTVLFLSTRLSEDAHVALIDQCNASHLLIDTAFQSMADKVARHCPSLSVHLMASQEDIAKEDASIIAVQPLDPMQQRNNIALIIHSSGSTSLPKPNYYTHSAALQNFQSQFSSVNFVTVPLFHMQGLGAVFRSITNRKPAYMWNASLPLTSKHLTAVLREHPDIQILHGVPYTMKLLADSEEGTELCRRLDVLLCAGGACPKPVGDFLTSRGVYLVALLGSSETGQLMNSYRPREEISEWDWLRPSAELQKFLRWEPYENSDSIFEMVVLDGWPSKVATNRADGSYATKDLWERHPGYPKKNAWRYYARKDDTIVLVNGEKVNPILFEDSARESPLVDDAIVFGAQKASLGIFVIASAASTSDEEVIEVVWPLVERANIIAPAHAQISKEMIRVLDRETARQVKKTDKSTIIRSAFYKDFADLIDAAYQQETGGSLILDRKGLLEFIAAEVRALVQESRQDSIEDDADLFSIGFDSLQASRLRSRILTHIDVGHGGLNENFVFDHPSIEAMTNEILRSQKDETLKPRVNVQQRMEDLIEKYSSDFPTHQPSSTEAGENVIVTGATGSLGAHIVAQLAKKPGVQGVRCLVRAKSYQEARERVRQSLRDRGLDVAQDRWEAMAVNFKKPRLGLSDAEYSRLLHRTTSVIHSAWNVNFNLSLESFEADCIRGTRSVIDLCLRTQGPKPARLVFCSSISAVADTPAIEIEEEPCGSMSFAQKMGYAQSKLVAENICLNASKETGLAMRILRIGQIVGDTKLGIWNRPEAVPMIIRSAETVNALPELEEECSWLPVDVVAGAVIDCKDEADESETALDVYHIVNKNKISWSRNLLPMLRKAEVEFASVSPQEWLVRLRHHPDPVRNPPYKLIDFFTAKYGGSVASQRGEYQCEKARCVSKALREYSTVDQQLINRFVRYILDR